MRKRLRLVSFGVVLGLLTVGVTALPAGADPMGEYDNVIQSVSVELGSNNTVVSVSDTTVGLSADGENVEGSHEQRNLDPNEAVSELPVRIVTHYSGDWGEGWDLNDIKGKDGKVTITVDIQNLTAKPQKISFDAAGLSQSRSVIVGAPITVMASVEIPNTTHVIAGKDVVSTDIPLRENTGNSETSTSDYQTVNDATNGVISSSNEDTTVVQWASLLAPPYTPNLASFTLTLQGKDLHVPDFSIAAQKGFLANLDPALQLFSSHSSETTALVNQTIDLSAQLADILERTETTMSETRRALQDAQDTIASKTVSDLQNSSHALVASTQSLKNDLNTLSANIKASLQSNNDATLARMQTVTTNLETIIGNTSLLDDVQAPPPSAGDACVLPSSIASNGNSLIDTLVSLSNSLDVYANATEACRDAVQNDLLNVLGPENPQDCNKDNKNTLQCTANSLRATISKYDYANSETANKIQDIPSISERYVKAFANLDCSARSLQKILDPSKSIDFEECTAPTVTGSTPLITRINTANTLVSTMKKKAGDLENIKTTNDNILSETVAMRKIVCDAYDNKKIDANVARELLLHIDGNLLVTCNVNPENVQPTLLTNSVKRNANDQETSIDNLSGNIDDIKNLLDNLEVSLSELEKTTDTIGSSADVHSQIKVLQDEANSLATEIDKAKQDASIEVSNDLTNISSSLENAGNKIERLADSDSDNSLNKLLTNMADGLRSASSTTIRNNNKDALETRQAELNTNYEQLKDASNKALTTALTEIQNDFSLSARDAQGASDLLQDDFNRVLADIGTTSKGTGLLGSMSNALGRADAANKQISVAGNATYGFTNVQQIRNNSEQLRRAQLRAGIVKADKLGAFMRNIPTSTRTTVTYSFTMSAQ